MNKGEQTKGLILDTTTELFNKPNKIKVPLYKESLIFIINISHHIKF